MQCILVVSCLPDADATPLSSQYPTDYTVTLVRNTDVQDDRVKHLILINLQSPFSENKVATNR
jgi:hypothetical protein